VAERILADTGPMVALFSEADQHHQRCSETLALLTPPLFTCWPVVTEAVWLLRKRPDAVQLLFQSFAGGMFTLLPLSDDDVPAIATFMKRYESAGLQFADAALAHLAEREKIRTVFTTDRRDFSLIRLKRNRALRLIPEVQ
jgi:predicted nucleic acid-binding protein